MPDDEKIDSFLIMTRFYSSDFVICILSLFCVSLIVC